MTTQPGLSFAGPSRPMARDTARGIQIAGAVNARLPRPRPAFRLQINQRCAVQAIQTPALADTVPARSTSATTEDAMGLGRTGDRKAKVA